MKSNKEKKTLKSWLSIFWYKIKTMSIIKHILIIYLLITLIGSLFLFTPWAQVKGNESKITYLDSLFTAASAFSDTGLITKPTFQTWTFFGQAIIAIMIFTGGIGWFAIKVYIFNILFGRPLSFMNQIALSKERGSSSVGVSKNLVKIAVSILLILVLIFSFVLTLYFYFNGNNNVVFPHERNWHGNKFYNADGSPKFLDPSTYHPKGNWGTSIRFGIFHTISAINNAGFDIISSNSLIAYYNDFAIQFIFIILFVIGGVGFPVIYDVYSWIKSKIKKEPFKWSLFTKVSMLTYGIISIVGVSATFGLELTAKDHIDSLTHKKIFTFWNNPNYGSKVSKGMALFFNSMSTRNAGFATIDLHSLSSATKLQYSILMFIGSAPSSTAGGIRTTTMALIVMGIWAKIRGRNRVRVFNRRIPTATITRSFVVFVVAIIALSITIMIGITSFIDHGGVVNTSSNYWRGFDINTGVYIPNQIASYSYMDLIFETTSAFGTTGLSMGITPMLSIASKIALIIMMFVGQLGVSSSILFWDKKSTKSKNYAYIKEDITIG